MNDTIVAVGTPPGEGGIGILRLSGPDSRKIVERFFRTESPSWGRAQQLCYGYFEDSQSGARLDDGYAVMFESPRSYTGEDAVEIYVHGSPAVLEAITALSIRGGARVADPGEFTRRAFLNDKVDLVQAEAVAELISSRSYAELEMARKRLDGDLSDRIETMLKETKLLLAECEADIDFPDENLPLEQRSALLEKVKKLRCACEDLMAGYEATKRLHDGVLVALVGAPNVGKSSLFNQLLMTDSAIVTAIPGTTRDLLREELILEGRRVKLVDTAGLRGETQDEIERIGMERTRRAASDAELVLFLCDSTAPFDEEERKALEEWCAQKKTFLVWSKIDLGSKKNSASRLSSRKPSDSNVSRETSHPAKEFRVSAKTGEGLKELRKAISAVARETTAGAQRGLASERQWMRLKTFRSNLEAALENWNAEQPELAASDLRKGYVDLSQILGREADVEDILDEIFSQFCIGK